MKKVNMDVMQRWITQRITSLLGFEDDIVVGTCVNYLSEEVGCQVPGVSRDERPIVTGS